MALINNLLVPIDFSPSSESGLRVAASLARRLNARVCLLHVLSPRNGQNAEDGYEGGESPNEADAYSAERLAEFATACGLGKMSEQLIEEGETAEVICRQSEQRGVDLIVLGTRGFGVFRTDLLGSNTAKVLYDTALPVLTTVHGAEPPVEASVIANIVCSVDLNAPDLDSLHWAQALARELSASLHVLYVAPELPIEEQTHSDFQATLVASIRRRMNEVLSEAGLEAESIIETGELGPTVSAVVRRLGAGLLILGRRSPGRRRITGHAFEILRSSPCPVVTV